jgi:hypothetical protein
VSDYYEVAIDGLRAGVGGSGHRWTVGCEVSECRARIVGFSSRAAGLRGGLAHLVWHLNGKPTCRDCGAWLAHRTSKRCRKGTCEAGR